MLFFSVPIMFSMAFGTILGAADLLLMGHYTGALDTGIYSAAATTVSIMLLFPAIIANLNQQVLVEANEGREPGLLQTVYRAVLKWIFFFNFPLFLYVLVYSRQIMSVLYGARYAAGGAPLAILSAGYLLYSITYTAGDYLQVIDRPKSVFWANAIPAVFAVATGIIFIPVWGAVGAAATAAVSVALVGFIMQFEVYRHTKTWPYPVSLLKAVAAAAASLALVFLLVRLVAGYSSLWVMVGASLIYVALYVSMLFLMRAFDPTDILLLKMVEKRYGIRQLAWLRKAAKGYYNSEE